jgi:hypothetical protein
VNRLYTDTSSARASLLRAWSCHSRARLVAQRSSQDKAPWQCARSRDCRKFWGVSVKGVFPCVFFDREWTRGLGFEVGENRR